MNKVRSLVEQIELLRQWLAHRDFDLIMGGSHLIEDSVEFEDKIVFISTRSSLRNQVYSLLHECGHVVLRKDIRTYYKKYPATRVVENIDGRKAQSKLFLVEMLDEELRAWEEGRKLYKELGFAVNSKKYDEYAADCVMWYIKKVGRHGYRGYLKTTKEIEKEEQQKRNIDIPHPI